MTEPTSGAYRHPWRDIKGPRADLPPSGGPGELPYAGDKPDRPRGSTNRRRALVAGGIAVFLGAATVAGISSSGGDEQPEQHAAAATTTSAVPSSTTTRPPTTTTTTSPPASKVPVSKLPRHEAVYRDGKLILQGTVPSKAVRDRFRAEAAAVIGADNVIVRYQIDSRVPVPTDGRVRIDEDFLFAKNSAEIDGRYEPLMQLGVTVLKLNPQARMRIVGYTDDSGTPEVNLRLSAARAQALRGYLALHGIDPSRVEAVGRGEVDFVAPNDTEEHRGRNRRIEVELLDLLKG